MASWHCRLNYGGVGIAVGVFLYVGCITLKNYRDSFVQSVSRF
jgi:hypothetical protein